MTTKIVMTPAQLEHVARFRADLNARGISLSQFCIDHQLSYTALMVTLQGRTRGLRGKTHEVFVKLGLKPDPTKSKA